MYHQRAEAGRRTPLTTNHAQLAWTGLRTCRGVIAPPVGVLFAKLRWATRLNVTVERFHGQILLSRTPRRRTVSFTVLIGRAAVGARVHARPSDLRCNMAGLVLRVEELLRAGGRLCALRRHCCATCACTCSCV